ncbi:hypothetical protein AERO9AM_20364 [Aeromicrobium sp. 9AM]|nr:hypothetical protein AERO9AM_20364 [Aeromicrobium sp. 9AM]
MTVDRASAAREPQVLDDPGGDAAAAQHVGVRLDGALGDGRRALLGRRHDQDIRVRRVVLSRQVEVGHRRADADQCQEDDRRPPAGDRLDEVTLTHRSLLMTGADLPPEDYDTQSPTRATSDSLQTFGRNPRAPKSFSPVTDTPFPRVPDELSDHGLHADQCAPRAAGVRPDPRGGTAPDRLPGPARRI